MLLSTRKFGVVHEQFKSLGVNDGKREEEGGGGARLRSRDRAADSGQRTDSSASVGGRSEAVSAIVVRASCARVRVCRSPLCQSAFGFVRSPFIVSVARAAFRVARRALLARGARGGGGAPHVHSRCTRGIEMTVRSRAIATKTPAQQATEKLTRNGT